MLAEKLMLLLEEQGATAASGFVSLLSLAFYVVQVIGLWKIFERAGEAGWKSIIPLLNLYVMFKIVYGNGWKALLLLVPILGTVLGIAYYIRLAQAYGHGVGYGLGLLFLNPIFIIMLGFENSSYRGPCSSFL